MVSTGSVLRELGVCAEWAGPGLMETLREQCSGGEYWQCPHELGVCAGWAGPGLMETLREQCSGGEYWQCPQRAGRLCRVGRSRADGDAGGTVLG